MKSEFHYNLWALRFCPFVQRVVSALEIVEGSYEITWLKRDDLPSAFLSVSPLGKVPVLVTPQGPLYESLPQVEYLLERHRPELYLNVTPFDKAKQRAAVELTSQCYLKLSQWRKATTEEEQSRLRSQVESWLSLLEEKRDEWGWSPKTPSLVEIAVFPALERFHCLVPESHDPVWRRLVEWKELLAVRFTALRDSRFEDLSSYYVPHQSLELAK